MNAPSIASGIRQFLAAHAPFSQMSPDDLAFAAAHLELAYFAKGETLLERNDAPPTALFIVKQGLVEGIRKPAAALGAERTALLLTPGETFPVGALLADRPASTVYRAASDTFCWLLPRPHFDALTRRSAVFLDFCRRRLGALLDLSNDALQASYAAQTAQWRSMSAPLASVVRRAPVTAAPHETLRAVFERMESEAVGSVVVVDDAGSAAGIFTRQDVIGRVSLPQRALDTPIADVMTAPVRVLEADQPIGDAMLLMVERTIRHVPVVRAGALVGVVTERDLFVLQRRSIRQIGDAIRAADGVDALRRAADDIRAWSTTLVAQGVAAGFVTRLLSRLNDQLTQRLIELLARRDGVPLQSLCWLALGSEGRQEQTIATDQDNGLVIAPGHEAERERLLAFAQQVNQALDACGYPLCAGGVMAGNPRWCLPLDAWVGQFDAWIDRGDPDSLLNASVFFDFRALAGATELADRLREHVTRRTHDHQRFLKQMSDNALRTTPPLSWTGNALGQLFRAEVAEVDLKLNGTSPFVDGARLLALAHGVPVTNTADRLQALADAGVVATEEIHAWTDAFQFLQSLRLRVQHRQAGPVQNPNLVDTRTLSELDRRILKEAFRQARKLQQRLALDFPG